MIWDIRFRIWYWIHVIKLIAFGCFVPKTNLKSSFSTRTITLNFHLSCFYSEEICFNLSLHFIGLFVFSFCWMYLSLEILLKCMLWNPNGLFDIEFFNFELFSHFILFDWICIVDFCNCIFWLIQCSRCQNLLGLGEMVSFEMNDRKSKSTCCCLWTKLTFFFCSYCSVSYALKTSTTNIGMLNAQTVIW